MPDKWGTPKPPGYQSGGGGGYRTYGSQRRRDRRDGSGSNREENNQFEAVIRRKYMTDEQAREFHDWLHSNHGIDGNTTDLKFNQLLMYADEFMRK